ncbi:Rne/Rng family ribonuclease [Aestuariimicrobium sp. T2.26MG-19.2B]|uniref:Rne/Rng family ribonuclease n=1 Tax=Aestuariimicrobium sp. T2.26MG-19.2B TaxID=3040679 RepID=UPI002477B501|nr:Rne/Rng family ribonuclease [Aestuariimicrobium sp. T2.26MG-19.2B]CAI9408059.1 Ribonuclease E [Aestuariimicrobium sp. T2.26MG-19.2B]
MLDENDLNQPNDAQPGAVQPEAATSDQTHPDQTHPDQTGAAQARSGATQAPRRRRAASRPAGPPVKAPQVESAAPAAEPLTKAAAEASPAPEVEVTEASTAKRPARRRATRAQGTATSPAAESTPVDSSAVEVPGAELGVSEPTPEVEASPESDAAPVESAPAAPAARATRGRRTRRTPARSEATTEAPAREEAVAAPSIADDLDSRLEAARAQASSRRQRTVAPEIADPFRSPELALQSLAASIAGLPSPASTDETLDVPTGDAEDIEGAGQDVDGQNPDAQNPEGQDLEAEDAGTGQDADTDQADEPADVAEDDESNEDDAALDEQGERSSRRRRRRRGGRRRRRGADDDSDDDQDVAEDENPDSTDDSNDHADDSTDSEAADDSEATDEGADELGDGRRRRRRRRRRGEDTSGAEDDPSEVVVRVREPRRGRGSSSSDEVTGIEGSTRMAAKRLRRQEGRAAGRRRAPILSEAEFLARREAVERRMVIRQADDYTQIAVLEDGVLVEHYVDRDTSASMIGNIYLGRIQNVLPGMEAAFIDIGRGRNAVLYAGEVDWDAFGAQGDQRKVETVFKSGQTVLVQVTKDPVGAKGARLTSHISIPGRYIVYSPGGHLSGISRKLADTERQRLKDILGHLIDEKASVIVRTAAEGVTEDELVRDVNRLKAQWDVIEKKVKQGSAPQALYGEPDLTVRIVRDLFTEDFAELAVQGNGSGEDTYDAIEAYVSHVAPHLAERLTRWDVAERGDIFASHHIDEQITKALERKVFLPSGGSLIIDRTEAMTVIDVNTGRFTGTQGNLEATVTSNNLEAAEEIVRQLRLRDIGGIIVIDFIDMVLPNNRELLLRRLVECLGRDRTRHQVSEVTSLGLVQMTRKKIGTGLAEAFTEECEHCGGRGYHRSDEPVASQAPADGGDRRGSSGNNGSSGNSGSNGRRGGRRRRGSSDAD